MFYTERAKKNLKKMDRSSAAAIYSWVNKNLVGCEDPYRTGKALKGDMKVIWRYRVGNFRIFALIDDGKMVILLIDFRNREHAYEGEIDLESYHKELKAGSGLTDYNP